MSQTSKRVVWAAAKRRRLLDYLKSEDVGRYQTLIGRLSLRK